MGSVPSRLRIADLLLMLLHAGYMDGLFLSHTRARQSIVQADGEKAQREIIGEIRRTWRASDHRQSPVEPFPKPDHANDGAYFTPHPPLEHLPYLNLGITLLRHRDCHASSVACPFRLILQEALSCNWLCYLSAYLPDTPAEH